MKTTSMFQQVSVVYGNTSAAGQRPVPKAFQLCRGRFLNRFWHGVGGNK